MIVPNLDASTWTNLFSIAWEASSRARLLTPGNGTHVGAAAMDEQGRVYPGCNVQHRFRSHDLHAEVVAIGQLLALGGERLTAVAVVAANVAFTPCGACMDWIMEIGGPGALVGTQSDVDAPVALYRASDLMPHYPRRGR